MTPAKLNMGSGPRSKVGFVNADLHAMAGVDLLCNFSHFPWPFKDSVFDEVHATDVIEHLPDTVRVMEEIHRVTRPGARIVIAGLVNRVADGLVAGTRDIDDDTARDIAGLILDVNRALAVIGNEGWLEQWRAALESLGVRANRHGLVVGRACRLLLDASRLAVAECSRRLGLALSRGADPTQAGAWVEGFLEGSGLVLLTNDELWQVLDGWLASIRAEDFMVLLPLLRRTFATFPAGERRQIGERAARGAVRTAADDGEDIDLERAAMVEPVLRALLGDIDG